MPDFTVAILPNELDLAIKILKNSNTAVGRDMANQLELARPGLPVPSRKRAVVRTPEGIAILADLEHGPSLGWLIAKNDDRYDWAHSPGKVLEVLYEGDEEA